VLVKISVSLTDNATESNLRPFESLPAAQIITFCLQLVQNAGTIPSLLVAKALNQIRGMSNLVSKCLLSAIIRGHTKKGILSLTYALPQLAQSNQAIELIIRSLDGLLSDVVFGSHSLGYYYYALIIKELISHSIDAIYSTIYQALEVLPQRYFDGDQSAHAALEVTLQAMFKTVVFPFENTYVNYSTDIDLSQIGQANYPYRWTPSLLNPQFLQSLVSLVIHPSVSDTLLIETLRLMSMISSGRADPSASTEITTNFIRLMLTLGSQVLSSLQSRRRQPTDQVLEQLIDQTARLLKVWPIKTLEKHGAQLRAFLESYNIFTTIVFQREFDVGELTHPRSVAGTSGAR
jgi:hypothetical protein